MAATPKTQKRTCGCLQMLIVKRHQFRVDVPKETCYQWPGIYFRRELSTIVVSSNVGIPTTTKADPSMASIRREHPAQLVLRDQRPYILLEIVAQT
jgi:hypothetical protein